MDRGPRGQGGVDRVEVRREAGDHRGGGPQRGQEEDRDGGIHEDRLHEVDVAVAGGEGDARLQGQHPSVSRRSPDTGRLVAQRQAAAATIQASATTMANGTPTVTTVVANK